MNLAGRTNDGARAMLKEIKTHRDQIADLCRRYGVKRPNCSARPRAGVIEPGRSDSISLDLNLRRRAQLLEHFLDPKAGAIYSAGQVISRGAVEHSRNYIRRAPFYRDAQAIMADTAMNQNKSTEFSPSPARGGGPGWGPTIMNTTPESRLELYDRVAEAPDAIERLRKFGLDLAVRGKLVVQDPEDEPAELLDLVAKDKAGYSSRHYRSGWPPSSEMCSISSMAKD